MLTLISSGKRATLHLDDWRVGGPQPVSRDVECDSVLCVLLVVVLCRSPWSPFSTARATLPLDDWRVGGPQPVSRDVECDSVMWVHGQLACVVELRYSVLALLDCCE
ncbi:hypothetical protein Taro_041415 [Colocasia esculenta]|uniref:Uncharacterized protein n=1 Tax=Colocasia esculenta TaxID=4460 RepID=A0A843WX80_COLES|nr:hypothetical protein [Colocasia esculenta]